MRDPKRIEPTLLAVKAYWKAHPDLRLGQILSNACAGRDVFYVEDDRMLHNLFLLWAEEQ